MPEDETFRKNWRGWVRSSQGYSVRVAGRTGIDYQDASGSVRIDSEAMASPSTEIVVYTRSIPDSPAHPRAEVLERVRRALAFAGWKLTYEDA